MSSSLHRIKVRKQHFIACQRSLARLKKYYQRLEQISQSLSHIDEARNKPFSQVFQSLSMRMEKGTTLSPNEMDNLQNNIEKFTQDIQGEIALLEAELLEEQEKEVRTSYHRSKNLKFVTDLLDDKLPDSQPSLDMALIHSLQNDTESTSDSLYQAPISAQTTAQFEQIEAMIIRLGILDNQQDLSLYQTQYQKILLLNDKAQKQLKTDSLIFELATEIRQIQHLQNLRVQLAVTIAELESLEDEEAVIIAREAGNLVQQGSLAEITDHLALVNDAIIRIEQRITAAERRNVVLAGLRELGYQINENEVNAWLTDGQVVISHPLTPDYGLELGAGGEESTRFQVRTVAFSEERDTTRDQDIDAIWCQQHHQLQENLTKAGAELTIDRALPPGSGKMKVREPHNVSRQQRVVNHRKKTKMHQK
ncbi:hypothetical protein J8V57_05435 [Xenorhabdus sp. PB61.4]|uniref:hypothetical protein n=1 Tax=Xenorhabdus sp. PB61.4 TaxID=2788940 RepID=UPI001E589CBB|nr:hypothetical protein [Xenorhabdus sp. PB61.4]MCC8365724.1 hypothetical protein [Xenorhabdus sp. PB61.4]